MTRLDPPPRSVPRWMMGCLAVVAALAIVVGSAPGGTVAASPHDIRGTWQFHYVFASVTARPMRVVITDIDPSDAFSGDYRRGARVSTYTGTVRGDRLILKFHASAVGYTSTAKGSLSVRGKKLTVSGTWTDTLDQRGTFTGTLVKPAKPRASMEGGTRPSATLVICNRDMTFGSDPAVLQCNVLVTDASAQPGSRPPTGRVTWESETGRLAASSCMVVAQGGVSSCAVTLAGSKTELPIGAELPVTASYPGDKMYAPSEASHQLFGKATGYTESDQFGAGCNPAGAWYPSITCGDPVNPATGNLSMTVADIGISGRGFALAVARTYNAQAAADGATGRFGVGWSDEHEGRIERDGKRVTVHLSTGATVPFTAKGTAFTAPGWVTATLVRRKDKGYVLTLTDRTRFTFDAQGQLTSFADASGEPMRLTRDAAGAILTAADSSGRTLTFERDAAGRVTRVSDPVGRSVSYAYDAPGDLVAVTDVAGEVTRYTYDKRHRMTGLTDARGSSTATEYDADDRVVRQTDPLGNAITFEYAGTYPDGVTTITDGNGIRAAFEYRNGLPVAETQALGTDSATLVTHLYDGDMRHAGTVDANGGLWRVTRDKSGNILTNTDPLGRTSTATWNKRHDLTSATSATGIRTDVVYDDQGFVSQVVEAVGTADEATKTISRGDADHPADVTSVTDALGAITLYEYDAAGDVITVTDALGGMMRIERDALGWMSAVTDPMGATTALARDRRGQVTTVTDPMGDDTTTTWDAVGSLASITDALGAVTSLVRDPAGRTSGATLADGTTQEVTRDGLGDVTGQTDAAGAMVSRAYDPLRRVTSMADALGNDTSATYDAVGNILSTTNALGQVTRFTWDAANQLLAMDYDDDTPDVTFTYDLDGRRTSMTDGTGTSTYTYDFRNRLVSVTDGDGGAVSATWDLRGALTRLVYPDGLSVSYGYDALGRMTTVEDSVGNSSTFAYDAAGRLLRSGLGDGSVIERRYDARGSLLSISGGPVDLAYGRDALGRVASITDAVATREASHDVRGRLTRFGEERFELDAAGALTALRGATLSHDEAGRLIEVTSDAMTTSFTFDDAGRRIAQAGALPREYTYDQAGRLTSVDASTWAYDGDGLRHADTDADGSTALFDWLTVGGRPLLLGDGTNRFIYGPNGMPIAQLDATDSTQWMHTDQNGTVRALTDDVGVVVGTFAFDAYGLPANRTGTADTRLGFQGNYTDADSGLQFLLARVYDPGTAQFLTVDPLLLQTLQPYAFAESDPLTYGDPAGTDAVLAGHGSWGLSGGFTTVPEGTTVIFHTPAGWGMNDELGTLVEDGGRGQYQEVYGPGSVIPNYLLSPPGGLNVRKTSRTVSSPTSLQDLLNPYQGDVHWAACRSLERGNGEYLSGNEMFNQWVQDHSGDGMVHASDAWVSRRGWRGWGVETVPVFGDTSGKKMGWRGGGYWIAEPVIRIPGV